MNDTALPGGVLGWIVAFWVVFALIALASSAFVLGRRRAGEAREQAALRRLSELQADQRRVEEQREALAAIIESSDDAILGETIEGIVTTWNAGAERVYGYATAEVLGRHVDFLLPEDRPNEVRQILLRIAQGERIQHFETLRRRKDGRLIPVSLSVSPVKDAAGRVVGASAIARDISDRVQSEETLREQAALARLGGMAAVVAHEVRNPLAGIGGALHVIRDRMPADAPDRAIIGEILARLDALDLLVEDLLLFARPKPPRFAPVTIRPLLERTVAHLRRDGGMADLAVTIEGEDAGLSADGQLLESAFLNLLLNGAQAMGRSGSLRVAISRTGETLVVEVKDEGPGIPEEVRPRVFEPFFTTRHRGTGLGLPVVKRIVEAHRGHIELLCPPQGGTVARVSLPLAMPSTH